MTHRAPAILVIATLAALTLIGRPVGLGATVALLALYAATASRRNAAWWVLAAALAAVATVRAAAWVAWPALIASIALASLAASGGASWRQVGVGLVRAARLPQGGVAVLGAIPRGRSLEWACVARSWARFTPRGLSR